MLKTKKFEHQIVEKCHLCNKDVFTINDDWNTIIDFQGKNQKNIKFYHNTCLRDLIEGKGKIIEQNLMEKVGSMAKQLLGKREMPVIDIQ